MSKIGGLGRGLDALLGEAAGRLTSPAVGEGAQALGGAGGGSTSPAGVVSYSTDGRRGSTAMSADNVVLLDPHLLDPNPNQPRRDFDKEALDELAASIKEHGVVQPIIAEAGEGGRYRIVAGERRTRAAIIAGLDKVPVLLRSYDEQKRLEIALIENIQRADLNPIDEAAAYQSLMTMASLNQEELSQRVGKKRSTVANAMRLLSLSDEIKASIVDGTITAGHARALLSVSDEAARTSLFYRIKEQTLSVRDTEKAAGQIRAAQEGGGHTSASGVLLPQTHANGLTNGANRVTSGGVETSASNGGTDNSRGENGGKKNAEKDPDIMAIEQLMLEKQGTKCRINGTLERGKVEIDYYSRADLDRLCALLT